jgi:hypothetical protein
MPSEFSALAVLGRDSPMVRIGMELATLSLIDKGGKCSHVKI